MLGKFVGKLLERARWVVVFAPRALCAQPRKLHGAGSTGCSWLWTTSLKQMVCQDPMYSPTSNATLSKECNTSNSGVRQAQSKASRRVRTCAHTLSRAACAAGALSSSLRSATSCCTQTLEMDVQVFFFQS